MSWRANFRQQLLQHRDRITHHARTLLGTWPGLVTLALLLVMLASSMILFSRASTDAAAQAIASSPAAPTGGLAQLATRTPTRRATVTRTPTATITPYVPTATWTPFPTATPVGASPLLPHVTVITVVVPLPDDLTGPQLAPVDVVTESQAISATLTPTLTVVPATTATIAASTGTTSTSTMPDATQLLVPTATPTPTRSITEALEQPVGPGGLAGIVATATAAAPVAEAPSESAPEDNIDIAPEATTEQAAPQPAPTAASHPTPDGTVRSAHVPILMYHYISVPPAGADIYRQDLSVAPDLFAAHLDAMQQAGYTPISLYTWLDHLLSGAPMPEKPVVLTFDDGYRDNYTNAFPMLRDRGLTATFFVVTDFINDGRPEYLTWDMVREMYAGGMSIEGHGRNHVSLANKDSDYLIWQALGTYESIEHEIGVRPRFISYPAGEYDQRTIDIFRSANYWAGFTTQQGATHSSDDLFRVRRIRVRGSTTPEELLRILALDW